MCDADFHGKVLHDYQERICMQHVYIVITKMINNLSQRHPQHPRSLMSNAPQSVSIRISKEREDASFLGDL